MSQVENALASLSGLPPDTGIAVGLSGGMDSVVLLHAVSRALPKDRNLRALHVNHGLQTQAGKWEDFCRELCAEWQISLEVLRVDVPESGASLENRARIVRYRSFTETLRSGELLLLAHHLDDQMETMLLRLLRGAGARGLSGIPARRKLGQGALFRPLLDCAKAELADYARQHGLRWVEDESNLNTDFDRNYCRHEVLPVIERRWPGYRRDWEKSRTLISECRELLKDLAELDFERCAGDADYVLRVDALQLLSEPRKHNVMHYWIERGGGGPVDWRKLQDMAAWLVAPEHSVETTIELGGYQVRRFGNGLYLLPEMATVDRDLRLVWNPAREPVLELPGNGSLHAVPVTGEGLAGRRYEVRYRQGGESCRLARRPGKTLKKILNEAGVEPWLRDRLPLLFEADALICIPGIGAATSASASPGYHIEWRGPLDGRIKEFDA